MSNRVVGTGFHDPEIETGATVLIESNDRGLRWTRVNLLDEPESILDCSWSRPSKIDY
jgi:hypothetical protein